MRSHPHRVHGRRGGFTLVEVLIASGVLALVLLSTYALIERDMHLSRSTLGISVAETRAQSMLFGIERELADARGEAPRAQLTLGLGAGSVGGIEVDATAGFPPAGQLLLSRGTAGVERVGYGALDAEHFLDLERAQGCTNPAGHPIASELLWCGLAEPIELQVDPPANLWDGRARVGGRSVYFRGDGTGFVYRVPTDPAGGSDFLDGGDLRWGGTVAGTPTLDGWQALVFVARERFDEAITQDDVNKDGDRTDVFDIGQLRRLAWNAATPGAAPDDLGLGPTAVLQERCHPGSDLDHDGFEDPLFLWDAVRRELTITLFVLGRSVQDQPVVRKVATTIFLRNDGAS